MRIAQPEFVAKELAAPTANPDGALLLMQAGTRCVASANALKSALQTEGLSPRERATLLGGRLMLEELGETLIAMAEGNTVEMADGLADQVYVDYWTAIAHGVDLDAVLLEVQRSNLAKFPIDPVCGGTGGAGGITCANCHGTGRMVLRDTAGKVQKPPGWTPPDVAGVLAQVEDQRRFWAEQRFHDTVATAFPGRKSE